MKRYPRYFLVLVVCLLAALPNSIKVSDSAAAEYPVRYGGKFVVALNGDIQTFNPTYTTSYNNHLVGGQIFNSLMEYDPWTLEPIPELAESWEISKDGLTYTFRLVKNAFWHDGKPFTSADVKFSFEQAIIPFHPRGRASFGFIKFETPDPYTVVMRLSSPFAPLLNHFTLWYSGIIPKHIYEGTDIFRNPRNFDNPIGTGPFMFKEWVKGSHIRLVRNPNYWRKGAQGERLPYLDEIIFKSIPDNAMGMLAFDKGEVDYMPLYVPPVSIKRYTEMKGVKAIDRAAFGSMYTILMNLQGKYLSNKQVRYAIAHAIDKDFMMKTTSFGLEKVATGPVASTTTWAYEPNVRKFPYNVTLANMLLDEAGFMRQSGGSRFRLKVVIEPTGREVSLPICEIMKSQLRDVGIDLDLVVLEEAVSYEVVYMQHDFDMSMIGGLSTAPDPNMLRGYLHGASIKLDKPVPTLWNVMIYNNSRVNAIFDQAAIETDVAKRAALYKEMQRIIVDDLPCLWIGERAYWHIFKDEFPDSKEWKGGLPVGPYGGLRERADRLFWKKGTTESPESALQTIQNTQKILESLRGQFYDVSDALRRLEEAKNAYNSGNYPQAQRLALQAAGMAQPPYLLYLGVAAVVAAVIVLVYRRKKAARKSP